MLEKKLGGLKSRWKRLLGRVLDDPGAGEPDQRPRFREDHVPQGCKAGGDPAGRGVGQHGNEGKSRRGQPAERRAGLGHLHEREDALLHARAARGAKNDARDFLRDRRLDRAGDLLARRRAQRAAAEAEIQHRQRNRDAMDGARPGDDRFGQAAVTLIALQPFGIGLGIDKLERIARAHALVHLHPGALVKKLRDPEPRPDRKMVAALRHHHLVVLDLLVEEDLPGEGVLGVKPLRNVLFPRLFDRIGGLVEMHGREGLSAVGKGGDVELQASRLPQRASATVEGGTRGKDVVDENVAQPGIQGRGQPASAKAFFRLARRARRSNVVCVRVSATRRSRGSDRRPPPAAAREARASSALWL